MRGENGNSCSENWTPVASELWVNKFLCSVSYEDCHLIFCHEFDYCAEIVFDIDKQKDDQNWVMENS